MKDAARGALPLADHFQDSDSYIHHFEFEGEGRGGITTKFKVSRYRSRMVENRDGAKLEI